MDFFNTNVSGRTKGFLTNKATNWHVYVDKNRDFFGTGFKVYANNSDGIKREWKYDSLEEANQAAEELAIALENGEMLN